MRKHKKYPKPVSKQLAQKSQSRIEDEKKAVLVPRDSISNSKRPPAWMLLLLLSVGVFALLGALYKENIFDLKDSDDQPPGSTTEDAISTRSTETSSIVYNPVAFFPAYNLDPLISKAIKINQYYGIIGGKIPSNFPKKQATDLINAVLKEAIIASRVLPALEYLMKHNQFLDISFYAFSATEPTYKKFGFGQFGEDRARFISTMPPDPQVALIGLAVENISGAMSDSLRLLQLLCSLTNEFSHLRHTTIMRAIYYKNPQIPIKTNLPYVTPAEQKELHNAIFKVLSVIWKYKGLLKLEENEMFRAYMTRIFIFNVPSINRLKEALSKNKLGAHNKDFYNRITRWMESENGKTGNNVKKYAQLEIGQQEKELVSDMDKLYAFLTKKKELTDAFKPLHDYYESLADKYLKEPTPDYSARGDYRNNHP